MHFNIIFPSTYTSLKCSLLIAMREVHSTAKTDKLDTPHYIAWNLIAAKCAVYHKWWEFGRELKSKSARKGRAFTRNKESAIWWHKTSLILPTKIRNKYGVNITVLFSCLHFTFTVIHNFLRENLYFQWYEENYSPRDNLLFHELIKALVGTETVLKMLE